MKKNNNGSAILIILIIVILGIMSATSKSNKGAMPSPFSTSTSTESISGTPIQNTPTKQSAPEEQIKELKAQIEDLEKQIQIEENKKIYSEYKDKVTLSVNRSSDPREEYLTLRVNSGAGTNIQLTGWTLKSLSSGNSATIPKGTYLFFAGTQNLEENINVTGGNVVYVVTGSSPDGVSFKTNKCSGYLEQFQNYTPFMSSNCPLARNEDLSGIPDIAVNDDCLSYINSFPSCKTQTTNLPTNWSYECKNFITTKLNYASCVNTHKNDKDFYGNEWRVYLKRGQSLWKSSRENIVLYDSLGKIVSTLKY